MGPRHSSLLGNLFFQSLGLRALAQVRGWVTLHWKWRFSRAGPSGRGRGQGEVEEGARAQLGYGGSSGFSRGADVYRGALLGSVYAKGQKWTGRPASCSGTLGGLAWGDSGHGDAAAEEARVRWRSRREAVEMGPNRTAATRATGWEGLRGSLS